MRCHHTLHHAGRLTPDSLKMRERRACPCPVVCEASQGTLALLVDIIEGLMLRRLCVLR